MNRKLAYAAALLLLSTLGCVTSIPQNYKSYSIGKEQSANIGNPMITYREATLVTSPAGCLGPGQLPPGATMKDGQIQQFTENSWQEDLIYTGKTGSTIQVSYREYRRDLARPAFFQELRYDLSESKVIVFKRYSITVLEATNQSIRFRVDSDYSRSN